MRIKWAAAAVLPVLAPRISADEIPQVLGRLATKDEPAGKIRVFAMVDAWTQWIMRPFHDMVFYILKFIPQDGTFDQPVPAQALVDKLTEKLSKGESV